MHTLVMKRRASLALWHWSQSLERRVLAAWLLYAIQKRRKKERYNQAMERHRKRLITTGVRQWIKVGLSMTGTHPVDIGLSPDHSQFSNIARRKKLGVAWRQGKQLDL